MRIVARGADLAFNGTQLAFPEPAGSAVDPGFPVAVSRSVTAAAEGGAFGNLQVPAIAGLEQLKVAFVMTIEAVVIAMVPAMGHHDVIMLLGDNHISFGVELQLKRLVLLVTGITIQAGSIATGMN